MHSNRFLPFFFGVPGASNSVMRNLTDLCTPAMEPIALFVRISPGGVAGIAVGWFATGALPALDSTSAPSAPFALAFLAGCGIDALSGSLGRMGRGAASDTPPLRKAAPAAPR